MAQPQTPPLLGRRIPPPQTPHPRRLRRLDSRAFGARRSRSFSFTTRTLLRTLVSQLRPKIIQHYLLSCFAYVVRTTTCLSRRSPLSTSYTGSQWLKWFCEAHPTKPGWSKPRTHSNPTNLALFRHKITLYRFNQGGAHMQGGLKWEQGG